MLRIFQRTIGRLSLRRLRNAHAPIALSQKLTTDSSLDLCFDRVDAYIMQTPPTGRLASFFGGAMRSVCICVCIGLDVYLRICSRGVGQQTCIVGGVPKVHLGKELLHPIVSVE